MLLPTNVAARVLGISTSHFTRMMKALGVKSASRRMSECGRPEKLWSKCQLFGLMVGGALVRNAGVSSQWADAFVTMVTTNYSDESLEAVLETRGFLVVAGGAVVPQFFTLAEANELLAANKETMGQTVSVRPLFTALMNAVRAAREEYA